MRLLSTSGVSDSIILEPRLEVGTRGGACDLEIRTRPIFLTMHLSTKFYHHMFKSFRSYRVDKQTHKQRDSAENSSVMLRPQNTFIIHQGAKTLCR